VFNFPSLRNVTAKVQKGIIKDIMCGEIGRKQNAYCSPAHFHFPIMAHTKRGGIAVVDKWQSAAGLFIPAM
jgi:hypothetical protein